jgi:hypothetical protein
MSSDCTVDKGSIENYYNNKAGFNFIPFLGESVGNSVMQRPPDHSDELRETQLKIQETTVDLLGKITASMKDIFNDVEKLSELAPKYTNVLVALSDEKEREDVIILNIQMISLAVVVLVIIFLGI